MKTVTVFPNRDKDTGLICTRLAIGVLTAYGAGVRVPEEFKDELSDLNITFARRLFTQYR